MKEVLPYDSREVLEQLAQGSSEAFTQIYNAYAARIYANILRLVKDPDLAQEFLQDVFMKVWENRAEIDPSLSFQSFLYKSATNTVLNYLKREKVKSQIENYLIHVGTELHTEQEDDLTYKQTRLLLDAAIAKLPPTRRQVYQLCKVEGNSYKLVSEQLNISTSTISDHIVKATKFLKEELQNVERLSLIIGTVLLYDYIH